MAKLENALKHICSTEIQYLDECAIRFEQKNNHNEITFGTAATIGMNGTEKIAIIVWADRSEMQKAIDIANSEENNNNQSNDAAILKISTTGAGQ